MTDTFLIKRPLITEKATTISAHGQYVFEVDSNTNKHEAKKAVEKLYKVHVVAVNMVKIPGKMKNYRGKKLPRSGYKKAIVTLREGDTISL